MQITRAHRIVVAAAAAMALVACGKGEAPSGGGEAKGGAAKAPAAAEGKPPAAKVNPTVVEHLKKIVAGCTINEKSGQAYSCKAKETNALRDWVRKTAPTDLYETLTETALGSNPKLVAAAVAQIDSLFTVKGDPWKKANLTPAVTDRLLKLLETKGGPMASKLAKYATHAAMMNGKAAELWAIVDAHEEARVRYNAYQYAMTYGRLSAFPKVKEVASGKDPKLVEAALRAPRNMYKATDAEKAQYCPWAKGFLGNADLKVATAAGMVMVNCKGEYIDALLAEGKKRVAAKQFKKPFSQVFREPCFEFMKGVTGKAGREKQCEAVYAFLESVADDETVDPTVRGLSLWNIYYQRRDKKSLDLMRKYESHKVPEIAKRAKDAIKSLTTVYKLE